MRTSRALDFLELAELAPALLFTVDANGVLDFVNARWTEQTGVPRDVLLRDGWRTVLHPDDAETAQEAWLQAWHAGAPFDHISRLRSASGGYRWVRARVEAQRDESGAIVRWFGTGFDVDDQQRVFRAMRLLSESGASLSANIDVSAMLEGIARGAFFGLADFCFFDLLEADGDTSRIVLPSPGSAPELAELIASQKPVRAGGVPGHSIARVLEHGETVYLEHIDDAWLHASAVDEAAYQRWRAAGLRSLVSAPLLSSGRTLGALTMLRVGTAHAFDTVDLRVIEEIGRRVGVTIEKARLNEAVVRDARHHEERYRSLADLMPQHMWTTGPDGTIDWFNQRWYEYTGRNPEEGPYDGDDVYHPNDVAEVRRRWALCQVTGEPFEMEYRIRRQDGAFRWFLTRAVYTRDAAGRISRWYGSDTDVDAVRRATRTLQFFADIGESLSESLGLQTTLEAVMQTVVPEFADWGFVNLSDEDGDLNVAAVYHRDPAKHAKLATKIGERYARAAPHGAPHPVRSREPVLYPVATYEDAARVVEAEVLDVFWNVGFTSVLVIPLLVGAVARGTLNVAMDDSRREFSADDVPFFRELGRRFGPAIANAEIYERELRVAKTFQEAALPAELPHVSGYRFSAIYEAGRAEALIGGDWYDAFALVDGRVVISIGDVAGSGLHAAVTMANVRQALRAVAQVHADPALMLEAADRTLRAQSPDPFVTAFVGVIDAITGTLSFANAGHPPPFVRGRDGRVTELACDGPPLGLREHERGGGHVMSLPPEAFIVLYTDGLIESTHDIDEGFRRLIAAVADPKVVAAAEPALAIHDAVLVEGSRDDVAILTVGVGEPPALDRWGFDSCDEAAAHAAVDAIREKLSASGLGKRQLASAELVIAELVGNTVRYAPGPIDVLLELGGTRPIVHVLDRGPGFEFAAKLPLDPYSESGRGLFLIGAFAEDINVVRRPDGGSHARAVLAIAATVG